MLDISDALEAKKCLIQAENEADIAAALEAGYEKALVSRLTLNPGKASSLHFSLSFAEYCAYTDLVQTNGDISSTACLSKSAFTVIFSLF